MPEQFSAVHHNNIGNCTLRGHNLLLLIGGAICSKRRGSRQHFKLLQNICPH